MSPTPKPGAANLAPLKARIKAGEIDTVIVAFPDVFGRLMGKRCTGEFFLDSVASTAPTAAITS